MSDKEQLTALQGIINDKIRSGESDAAILSYLLNLEFEPDVASRFIFESRSYFNEAVKRLRGIAINDLCGGGAIAVVGLMALLWAGRGGFWPVVVIIAGLLLLSRGVIAIVGKYRIYNLRLLPDLPFTLPLILAFIPAGVIFLLFSSWANPPLTADQLLLRAAQERALTQWGSEIVNFCDQSGRKTAQTPVLVKTLTNEKLIFLDSNDKILDNALDALITPQQRTNKKEELTVIGCVFKDNVAAGRQTYNSTANNSSKVGYCDEMQQVWDIALIDVASGGLIARKTFRGTIPQNCPKTLFVRYSGEVYKVTGTPPSPYDIKSWLDGLPATK